MYEPRFTATRRSVFNCGIISPKTVDTARRRSTRHRATILSHVTIQRMQRTQRNARQLRTVVDSTDAGDARKVRKQVRNERSRRSGRNARIEAVSILAFRLLHLMEPTLYCCLIPHIRVHDVSMKVLQPLFWQICYNSALLCEHVVNPNRPQYRPCPSVCLSVCLSCTSS